MLAVPPFCVMACQLVPSLDPCQVIVAPPNVPNVWQVKSDAELSWYPKPVSALVNAQVTMIAPGAVSRLMVALTDARVIPFQWLGQMPEPVVIFKFCSAA